MSLRLSLTGTSRTFDRPTRNAHHSWSERAACFITLESDEGGRGFGEASPLPGFSPDRLEDGQAALAALNLTNIPGRLEPGQSARLELSRASARLSADLPAARAGFEAALLDLWSRSAGQPAWALLSGARAPAPRRVSALLSGEPEQAMSQARAAQARGVGCFKLKIGRHLERELGAVRELRRELGEAVSLRIDANQSLSVGAARTYLPRFAAEQLEYIEEPCAPADLTALADLELPLAWDESLLSGELPALRGRALILKPSLLGGISACADWAERAARAAMGVVISHAFEGPLGLALSATAALCWGSAHLAHGLDLSAARLAPEAVPFIAGASVVPWTQPGFGPLGFD